MSSLTAQGTLHLKGEMQQITDSFRKHEFVLKITDGNYEQFVPFELTQDRCSAIEPFNEGDKIKVSFNLRGREWTGRYFVNLSAWRIEPVNQAPTQAKKVEPPKVETDKGDDLPF